MRLAEKRDIEGVMNIVYSVVKEMNEYGNYQWNSEYPKEDRFHMDIENGTLYVEEKEGILAGFICIDTNEAPEYKELTWNKESKSIVIHRMAINPMYRGCGLAKKIMMYAEDVSKKEGINYIKVDTCIKNKKMNSLIKSLGYDYRGNVKFNGEEELYCCYDKVIA